MKEGGAVISEAVYEEEDRWAARVEEEAKKEDEDATRMGKVTWE